MGPRAELTGGEAPTVDRTGLRPHPDGTDPGPP
ncbi:hypothetical protein GA0115242_102826 [Streptomyces sp. SolWspMP-5a-2]|nr:hypothetical protein GA0115242_102826 [Streptomyces sp. SolWspMP-5a-2]